jgi:hypothetical protein
MLIHSTPEMALVLKAMQAPTAAAPGEGGLAPSDRFVDLASPSNRPKGRVAQMGSIGINSP